MTTKTLDTLVSDIQQLFERGHICDADATEEFGNAIAHVVSDRLARANDAHRPTLRMSNIGRPCDRQIWYDINSTVPREPLPPSTKIKFLFGDIIEEMLLFLAKEAGHDVDNQQKEVVVDGIKGHIDATIDGVVVDVKSCSSYAFKKFQDGTLANQDSFGYIGQISGYREGLGQESGAFLAMDKTLGHLTLYVPDKFIDASARIAHIKDVVAQAEPPARQFSAMPHQAGGNEKLCVECSYCAHKKECWPTVRTFLYSHGPVFLVTVKKIPNVTEVV